MGVENLKQLTFYLILLSGLMSGCAHFAETVTNRQDPTPLENAAQLAPVAEWRPTVVRVGLQKQSADDPPTDQRVAGQSTLETFETLALSSNPSLAAYESRVEAARGRHLQVGLKPNPVAGVSVQEIGNEDSAGQYGAVFQQRIVTAGKLQLNRDAAAWEIKRTEEELAGQRLRVLTDVRRAFYSTRVAQERIKVAGELHGIARQAVLKARELVKQQEPRTVLAQAEIEVELAGLLLENSRTQLQSRWRQLAAVIGQPELPQREVTGDLVTDTPRLVWEQALERVLRDSPEVAAANAEVQRTRSALQRANVQSTPNVTLALAAFYDDASLDPFANFGLTLPIPVYNRNQGGIAEAQANVINARMGVERVQLSLNQRLARVFRQHQQARQQVSRYGGAILKKAGENLDLNRQSYERGQSSYLAVLTAQRSYSQTRLAWLAALEQLWAATVDIQGLLLNGSLD